MATTNYKQKSKEARLKVLEMIHKAGTSHIASNFSIIDTAVVLYENLKLGDKVVWSKGWVSATIYYFLAQQGKIPKEDLNLFGKEIEMHPNTGKIVKYLGLAETNIPGVLCNGGSMGHGLPIACGMALAKKLNNEPGIVYCIMSDGEMNEGTTWESAAFAAQHNLDNLVVIIDKNKWQAMGKTRDILNIDLKSVFRSFKWFVYDIDGHNFDEIEGSINNSYYVQKPSVIIARTIKGKGVHFMTDNLIYHYKHIDEHEYYVARNELNNA